MFLSTRSVRLRLVFCLTLLSLPGFARAHPLSFQDFTVPRRLVIVDANDTALGDAHIAGVHDVFLVLSLNDGQDFLTLPITPDGFALPAVTDLVVGFTTSDCTGQGYLLDINREGFSSPAVVTAPGHTLWVREADAVPEPVTLRSYVNTDCWGILFPDVWSFRARAVVDLDRLYTPPFRLRTARRVHAGTPIPK